MFAVVFFVVRETQTDRETETDRDRGGMGDRDRETAKRIEFLSNV